MLLRNISELIFSFFLPFFFLFFWDYSIIAFLSALSSLQTFLYISLHSLSNSWPFSLIVISWISISIHKYIILCPLFTNIYLFIYSFIHLFVYLFILFTLHPDWQPTLPSLFPVQPSLLPPLLLRELGAPLGASPPWDIWSQQDYCLQVPVLSSWSVFSRWWAVTCKPDKLLPPHVGF